MKNMNLISVLSATIALTGLVPMRSHALSLQQEGTATVASVVTHSPAAVKTYAPRQTRVALLPVINASGEKDPKQRGDQSKKGSEELLKQFRQRGFDVLEAATVQKAIGDLEIDLSDEEMHNRATLYKIGEAVGADLIAFAVITNVDQQRIKTPLTDDQQLEGRANIKIWVLDVKEKRAIMSATRQEAQAKNKWFAEFDSGARLIRLAVEGAVRDSLKGFLAQFPKN